MDDDDTSDATGRFAILARLFIFSPSPLESRMRRSPSIAPTSPDDHDIYLVLDDFGARLGRAWRETDEERNARAHSG